MVYAKSALRRNGFTFKQFFVAHDRCAMRVGTDGILLGAWAPVAGVQRILDIGAGSGLLALMLAQRTEESVTIDAVELDAAAAGQARENVSLSPWERRIRVHTADIQQWSPRQESRYDLIVSNPPWYKKGVACATPQRAQARYTCSLEHDALLACAAERITEAGYFCVVLPEETGNAFVQQAQGMRWHLRRRTDIAETDSRPPNRVLLAFSRQAGEYIAGRLAIRQADRRYSADYTALTRDFYLLM